MNETRAKVSIDDSGIDSFFDRIKRDAEDLGREMIQASRQYSTSSREVLKDIEEQISAIERRNRLDAEFERSRLIRQRDAGEITPEQFQQRATEVRQGSEEDRLQVQLLRDLIETVKVTARETIREDRKSVEEKIRTSRTVDQLSPDGDPIQNLVETLQRGILGDVKEGEFGDQARLASRALVGGFGDIAGAKNEIYGAISATGTVGTAAAAGVGGFAGGLIGGIISSVTGAVRRGLEATERMETARSGMIAITGRGMPDNWYQQIDAFANPASMGMSYSEFLSNATEYGRANVGLTQRGSSIGAMHIERGFGVDRGVMSGLARTQRGTTEDVDITTNRLISALNRTTRDEDANRAYLGEYLSILTDVNRQQLQVLGRVDSGVNTKMIAALTKVGGGFENPEVLKQVIGSIYTGLTQAQTPQVEALQYSTLSRLAPGASLWDLRKMMEDPFSSDYLPEMLRSMVSISGSRDDALFNVQSWLGLSGSMTERLVDAVRRGDIDSLDSIRLSTDYNLREEAERATGEQATRSARYRGWFEKQGSRFFDFLESEDIESGFRPPIPTQDAEWARSKGAREDYTRREADRVATEVRIVQLEKAIQRYEQDDSEKTELQKAMYEQQLKTLQEINGNLEQMNKRQRAWDANELKVPTSRRLW